MKKIRIKRIGDFISKHRYDILVFFLIFMSNEGFLFGVGNNDIVIKSKFFITIIICALMFLLKRKNFKKNIVFLFIILSSIVIVSDCINKCIDIWTLWRVILLFFSMIIVSEVSIENFMESFINVIVCICFLSLITYFINIFFPSIISKLPITSNYINTKFYNFFGINYIPLIYNSHYGIRNYSLFREPGVFACYIGIALLMVLLGNDKGYKTQFRKVIILSISMITTFSTSGILTFILILLTYALKGNKDKNITRLIILLFTFLAIFTLIGKFDLVFDKLFNTTSQFADSKNDRYNGIAVAFDLILRNPILGIGITNFDIESKLVVLFIGDKIISTNNYTITLLKIFAQSGIVYFLTYILGLFKFLKKICQKNLITFLSLFIIILIFSNEDFCLNILVHLFVFYGFSKMSFYKEKLYENG